MLSVPGEAAFFLVYIRGEAGFHVRFSVFTRASQGPFLFSSTSKTCEVLNQPQGTTCVPSLNSAHMNSVHLAIYLFCFLLLSLL